MLRLPDHWVWDFWIADDGDRFHLFFLHAPRSLDDDGRRHRAARIGHAVSSDLIDWIVMPAPFAPGEDGAFDATATWTGNVVRGDDGRWRMFYTGSRFLEEEPVYTNVQTIGVAISDDLMRWEKQPAPVARADPRWYEVLGSSGWKEECWRDPWVFRDPAGDGWHMLVTARSRFGALDDRGVVGHARSADLASWEVLPPLSAAGAGFGHLEVPQVAQVDDRWFLLFSCPSDSLSAAHAALHPDSGTWSVPIDGPTTEFDTAAALPLTDFTRYSGRLVRQRDGRWVLLTFENGAPGQPFPGVIGDPMPVAVVDGRLVIAPGSARPDPFRTPTTAAGAAFGHQDNLPAAPIQRRMK